jgi:hypothetical protein
VAEAQIVLETSALLAYAKGSEWVGEHLTRAAQDAEDVVVPALCLAEAYRSSSYESMAGSVARVPSGVWMMSSLDETRYSVTESPLVLRAR